jgi:hypothetical protein
MNDPHNVTETGFWAECLGATGEVLAYGKIWPYANHRLANCGTGLVVRARMTLPDGRFCYVEATSPWTVTAEGSSTLKWNMPATVEWQAPPSPPPPPSPFPPRPV